MKAILFFLFFALPTFAEDMTIKALNDVMDTSVVVTPLEDIPQEIPVKKEKGDAKWWKVTLLGLGLAPLEFFISTAIHEGSHAAALAASGGKVLAYSPYPHKHEGKAFVFGDVHWQGRLTSHQEAVTMAAPMILDTAVLGTYGGLLLGNALPKNKYAKMAMWVFAAGSWVDMANHFVARNEHTDTRRLESYFQEEHGLSIMQSRLVVRGPQVAILAAGGYFLYKGIRDIFKKAPIAPVGRVRNPKKKKGFLEKHNLYVSPSVTSDYGGMSFGGSF